MRCFRHTIARGDPPACGRLRPARAGFTLIELLVVVAILGLLMSLLLPALGRARRTARDTQCLNHLRSLFVATTIYLSEDGHFPDLNNDENEGALQYNYLIYDGRDFENGFGPLAPPHGALEYIQPFFCPVQTDPFHSLSTPVNPWPVRRNLDTRAAYGRRYGLSGKALSDLRRPVTYAADVIHLPQVVRSAHGAGVNAVYTDGHGQWVDDPGILTDNELTKPFDPADNPLVRDIWKALDRAGT